jgi:hypothetical protein
VSGSVAPCTSEDELRARVAVSPWTPVPNEAGGGTDDPRGGRHRPPGALAVELALAGPCVHTNRTDAGMAGEFTRAYVEKWLQIPTLSPVAKTASRAPGRSDVESLGESRHRPGLRARSFSTRLRRRPTLRQSRRLPL